MDDQQNLPPTQDLAFMGTVDLVLSAILRIAQEHERTEGRLPTAQELQDPTIRLIGSQEAFDELVAEVYGVGEYTRYHQDCEVVLKRFLALYEWDQSIIKEMAPFVGADCSPARRMRYIEMMRSAYLAIKQGIQWVAGEEEDQKMCTLMNRLFNESEEKS